MQYIKASKLEVGMRLARPIYNKLGVLLYERNSMLTASAISSIRNFGLWGIYILEPAEPVPPLTQADIDFEQFQTVATFQLKEDFELLIAGKKPEHLSSLVQRLLRTFDSSNQKINFFQNLRSTDDYVYKHCLSTAILSAMMVQKLHYSYPEQNAIVYAALLHDLGLLLVPEEILEKGSNLLSMDERRIIHKCLEKGYQLLHPDYNDYKFPELTLQIVSQMVRLEHNIKVPLKKESKFNHGTRVLHTASMFDELTSMNLGHEPLSGISAIRFLAEYPNYYPTTFIMALAKCIHLLPAGACVDFSNGQKGIVIEENHKNFTEPVIVLFSTNQRIDFSNAELQNKYQIKDIMKTMDARLPFNSETLKKYVTDPHTTSIAKRFFNKRRQK